MGTNGFLVTNPIPERAKDSSLRFPSTVTVPDGKFLSIVSVTGPSLQTLQHHLKSLAGGPNASTLSRNPSLPRALCSLRRWFSANRSTYSTVSGNSRPVSMFMSSRSGATSSASAHAARESLPPEKDTVTGRPFGFPSLRNLDISLTAALCMRRIWPRLADTKHSNPAGGETDMPAGASRSRILIARSDALIPGPGASAVPGPIFPPFFMRISGSPVRIPSDASNMQAPGIVLPLRCPDIPENRTTPLAATGANSSAPGWRRSRTSLSSRRS